MEQDWKRQEALKTARSKLAEAEALIEAAEEILNSNGYTGLALDAKEALDYVRGAQGE